jgi:hypothetical protein
MNNQPLSSSAYPETAKFLAWYEAEKAKGLVEVKFYAGSVEGSTMESFFAEVNQVREAATVPHKELF